jgi:hypothetical protein
MLGRGYGTGAIIVVAVAALIGTHASAAVQSRRTATIPPHPPQYDLDVQLNVEQHLAVVRQTIMWTNPCALPATELVFNAHSHYSLPDKDVGFMAKMLEILRMTPSEVLDLDGPPCEIQKATLLIPERRQDAPGNCSPVSMKAAADLPFHYREDNATALVVPLPRPLPRGETVVVELQFTLRLPQKQGRWGQWRGITFLSNWQPVLAVYDDHGWHPTPFIPWHQPFFNEAGGFHVHVTLAADQKIACTGSITSVSQDGAGQQEVVITVPCARDFAFLCCSRYCEYTGEAGPVHVRVMALPEHEHYAREMVRISCDAILAYTEWFGPYPYPEFTIAESYFGWNGNQCSGLVMIDERIFNMPHVADGFVDSLVSHEVCHQWWYNVVGVNGYCETWMDEGLATYFSHRLLNCKYGKNNKMLHYPRGLEWLPNISRETYRYYGLYGTIGRGEAGPTVQDIPKFDHVINLFSMCYDRGSKIVGMIEDRLGEAAFLDFMRQVYARYYFRILRVADFQRELEAYTGQSWEEFFHHWLYCADMTDWCVEDVVIKDLPKTPRKQCEPEPGCKDPPTPCHVTVLLRQKAQYSEQTALGFSLDGTENFQVRVPIIPQAPEMIIDDPPARIQSLPENRMRVDICLPRRPTQIAVDPDQLLVDPDPANNYWKPRCSVRVTPVCTLLDENDITTAYDRWNLVIGPWLQATAYDDPWYTRSPLAGIRAAIYRTQQFDGGVYLGYRADYDDLVVGVDGLWDHFPWPHTQIGFDAEHAITSSDDRPNNRASLFERYVFQYGDSLYLRPMHFVELFQAALENNLPLPTGQTIQGNHFDHTVIAGVHYYLDYLTPYWDPEGGFRLDAAFTEGIPVSGQHDSYHRIDSQFSIVKGIPDGFGWLSETRVAARIFGGIGIPSNGEYYSLGGSELLRAFDLSQRQGNAVWIASLEWRFPIVKDVRWDWCDHTIGIRNINGAAFYDVGDAYLRSRETGPIVHGVGAGLRVDVAWFSIVERSTIRFDVAKAVNDPAPLQFWLAFSVPF